MDRPVVRALFFAARSPVEEAALRRFVAPALFALVLAVVFAPVLALVLVLTFAPDRAPVFDAPPARVPALLVEPVAFVARLVRAVALRDDEAAPRFVVEAEADLRAVVPRVELVLPAPAVVRRAALFVAAVFLALFEAVAFLGLFVSPLSPAEDAAVRRFVVPVAEAFELLLFAVRPFALDDVPVELRFAAVPEDLAEVLRAELVLRTPDEARRLVELFVEVPPFEDEAFFELRDSDAFSLATNLKKRLVLPSSILS